MKNSAYKNYIVWGITVFLVIALSIILFFLLFRAKGFGVAFSGFIKILTPFVYGAAMAYVLNPIYGRLEKLFSYLLRKIIKKETWLAFCAHFISTVITLALTFVLLFGLLYMVLPQLTVSIFGIVEKMPDYLRNIREWLDTTLNDNPHVGPLAIDAYQSIDTFIDNWLSNELMPLLAKWALYAYSGLRIAVNTVLNVIIGIVVMVYLLNGKRIFIAQAKKLIYSVLGAKRGNGAIEIVRYAHRVFGGFIIGKLIESLGVGIMCFVFLSITKMPYPVLISVIIGITNIIPFFGPFIGALPSVLLLLFESPQLSLYFLIFILIVQLVDGNIIGPRILGNTTGLPSFWVLFAIILFGGMFGFIGMVVGVPLFALIYSLIKYLINKGLEKKALPCSTQMYKDLDYIDEKSYEAVKN